MSWDRRTRLARRASSANIRTIVRGLADEAGLKDTDAFARSWHILMKGSIVAAAEGDVEAAQRAKSLARLLDGHR